MAEPVEPADDLVEPFATVKDLRDRWPDMPVGADEHAATLLLDASQMIVDTVPSAPEAASLSTLKRITCAMVRRAMNIPDFLDGMSQVSETAGGVSRAFSPSNSTGDLYLTKAERKALGGGGVKAFSVQVAGFGRTRHLPWCNLSWGALYCSCGADIAGEPIYELG